MGKMVKVEVEVEVEVEDVKGSMIEGIVLVEEVAVLLLLLLAYGESREHGSDRNG